MVISAAITFFNLGNTHYPKSAFHGEINQPVILVFNQTMPFDAVVYLNGENVDQGFEVYSFIGDDNEWQLCHEELTEKALSWTWFDLGVSSQVLMIKPTTADLSILEMSFISGRYLVSPQSVSNPEAEALFDEQELVSKYRLYNEIMFFDEELHALTAYDFIHGMPPVELTHPPLGKSIIAIGIRLFGMTPFGWRFMCAMFGVLLIVPLYALAKLMFDSQWLAFFATFVFSFDFMRFVQSRVATLDIFLVTFIICMYLFMYKYMQTDPVDRLSRKALFYLGASGVFMGIAIAVKWSAAFAGLGLGALFVLAWHDAVPHYAGAITKQGANDHASKPAHKTDQTTEHASKPVHKTDRANEHSFIRALKTDKANEYSFKKDLAFTVQFCVIFFGIVPIAIYFLSYIPFARASGMPWLESIFHNQVEIFSHHAFLHGTHEFQSSWWQWPFDIRPVQYFATPMPDGSAGAINAFGSPALIWGGLLALVWCVKRCFWDKDQTARFLCIAWVAQILPWVFITRFAFIYHYFPCVPFLALMVAYFIKTRPQPHQWRYALAFGALVIIMFVVFFPVLYGMPISNHEYISRLQWLPGWRFID